MASEIRTSSSSLSQVHALFAKSLTYQRRQSKSNCCQILTPVILAILMFLLQRLVDSFVQEASGEGATIKGIRYPPVKPPFFLVSDNDFTACGAFRNGGARPAANGTIDGTSCPRYADDTPSLNLTVFTAEGVTLPIGSPPCAGNSSGFLNAFTDTAPQIFYRARVFPDRGNTLVLCDDAPFYLAPLRTDPAPISLAATQDFTFNNFQKFRSFGGFVFHALDAASRVFTASVYFNRTLSDGLDFMRYSSILTTAAVGTFTTGQNTTSFAGYRDFPTNDKPNTFDLISLIGPFFYIFVLQLQLPVLLSGIVHEKEHKLREIMKIMGLRVVPYYVVNYVFSFVFYLIVALAFWIMCALLQFRYWSLNSPGAIFLLLFIWGHVLVALVFLFATMLNKSSSATVGGYLFVFGNSLIASIIVASFLNQPATPRWIIVVVQLFPPFAFYRGLVILSNGVTFGELGLQWADINNSNVQMGEVYGFLIMEWFVLMALAIYIELVFSSGFGVRKHPLFLFHRATYCSRARRADEEELDINAAVTVAGDAPDVAAERTRAVQSKEFMDMRVTDLRKVYPARSGAPPKLAVKQLSLGLSAGTCLGFLGPNGAGKSTMISMIAGLFAPTSGSVHVVGYDSAEDPDIVHLNMGVCPQDDLLWPDLTSVEHLLFYGRLKMVPKAELKAAIDQILDDVSLGDSATRKKLVKEYSGGMKRRLSVACSLIGFPRLVLLDEPSTGLDPASRQQLWKVIRTYKKRCAMLLTTHSMEEAEELCDRVSIFVDGQLRAIGPAAELKFHHGQGYKITTLCDPNDEPRVDKFVRGLHPSVVLLNALAGVRNYEVPKDNIALSTLFHELSKAASQLGLKDWGVANSSLEEVFLKVLVASGWEHAADLGVAADSVANSVPLQSASAAAGPAGSSRSSYYSDESEQEQKPTDSSTSASPSAASSASASSKSCSSSTAPATTATSSA